MNYGALLAAMTSEYVEKAPVHDVDVTPRARMVQIVADPGAGAILARQGAGARLEAMDYDVVEPGDIARLPDGLMRLSAGADRVTALAALAAAVKATHSLGLIWIDSRAALEIPQDATAALGENAVLAQALGLVEKPGPLQPQLSPENVVLVGLREASPAEAQVLKDSRLTCFTMAEIDASGMRDVMREAIRIATTGTRGFHVSYSATATEIPAWAGGSGGMTVRETHQAMEAVALHDGMISMSVSGLTAGLDPRVASEVVSFVMSAFGKRIL
jgi:arginase family enzyme